MGQFLPGMDYGPPEEEWTGWKARNLHCTGHLTQKAILPLFFLTTEQTTSDRYQSGIPADVPPSVIPQIKTYVSTSDISLLSQALSILAVLLELSPSVAFPVVEKELLPSIYQIAHSPLVSGSALDSLLAFFSALVQADRQIATHVVPNLVIGVERSSKTESNPINVAKCIGQVVRSAQDVAAGTIAEYSKTVKVRFFVLSHSRHSEYLDE